MDEELNEEPEEEIEVSKKKFEKEEEQRTFAIHAVVSFVAALAIVLGAIVVLIVLVTTKKPPKENESGKSYPAVRVKSIMAQSHEVSIETQGVVRSMKEVRLAAEVGGRVVVKSEALVAGEEVKEGDVLVEIDSADYKAAVARAQSALADAELALQQEVAMSQQASIDLKKLGVDKPSELAKRELHVKAAEARVESARAELDRAQRDLSRTKIKAPFDAQIRMAMAEVGAVLAPGAVIAELYSTDELEVRLPFTLLDFGYLKEDDVEIQLTATVGGELKNWVATMDRVDGEVQRSTLSAYGLAKIGGDKKDLPPVGLFVEATVPGEKLENVVVLPRAAVRGTNEVWLALENKGAKKDEAPYKLDRRTIHILRTSREDVVARGEFELGNLLVLTRLAAPIPGMGVEVVTDSSKDETAP